MNFSRTLPVASFLIPALVLTAPQAWTKETSVNDISIAAGIAAPSSLTSQWENPAGLVTNDKPTLTGSLSSPNDSFDPLTLGGIFMTGNGSVGVGLGARHVGGGSTVGDIGLAASLGKSWNLGLAAVVGSGANNLNIGTQVNLGSWKLGLEAIGVTGGPDFYGAGLATDLGSSATFAIDASVNSDVKGLSLMPGLGVRMQPLSLALGYGIQVDDANASWIGDGLTAGLVFKAGRSIDLHAYYEKLGRYFFGLRFAL